MVTSARHAARAATSPPDAAVCLSGTREVRARRADGSSASLFGSLPADITAVEATHGALVLGVQDRDGVARSFRSHDVGTLRSDRWLALSRVKRWWMGPLVGQRSGTVPVETQLLLARCAGEGPSEPRVFFALLPLVAGAQRATLCGNMLSGRLSVHVDSGDPDVRAARMNDALVIAASADPYEAVRRAVCAASERVPGSFRVRSAKRPPAHLDYFGWCTWDAFYSAVRPEAVLTGVRSLRCGARQARAAARRRDARTCAR